jgi:hypothetical protein
MYVHSSFLRDTLPQLLTLNVARVKIDLLPDVVLLGIFDFYMDREPEDEDIEAWITLVHVCQNWRNVVFGSPRRLNVQLCCTGRTPVRENLDIWPLFPIIIRVYSFDRWDNGNIFAALEHNDRISEMVIFDIPSSETGRALTALQKPFPALTYLQFGFDIETAPIIPASFLGGSAPALETLCLDRIPFPGLPKLLLSATHLVDLDIQSIPHSGYISPEAIVACLSVLTRLELLFIGFESPQNRPDRRLSPEARTHLPVLTTFSFKGVSEYLEDLVARIDAPLLNKISITFFYQLLFDTPQLTRFISRTPKFKAHDEAHVEFSDSDVTVTLPRILDGELEFGVSCSLSDLQLSSVALVCSSSFTQTLIHTVERLYIQRKSWVRSLNWPDDIENSQWLELFQPFAAVEGLFISSEFAPRIAPALKELIGERVTEVLPALQTLFLEEPPSSGPVPEAIGQFVVARQLAGHPLTVSRWEREE